MVSPMDGDMSRGRVPLLTVGTLGFLGVAIGAIVVTSQAFDRMSGSNPRSKPTPIEPAPSKGPTDSRDEEYKRRLTPEQYHVTREKGTERAFSGKYWNNKAAGFYKCVCCGTVLFESRTKFDSGTGWPSFYEPVDESKLDSLIDGSLNGQRTEVICRTCKAHLGHVFADAPQQPTGLRYCINSAALDFQETELAPKKRK
jgi:peptide-methionine (R)-S-oxide reductase